MDQDYNSEEQSVVKDKAKEVGQRGAKKFGKWAFQRVKSLIKMIPLPGWAAIGTVILAILAFTVIVAIITFAIEYLLSLLGAFSPTQSANTNTSQINQTASIIRIDEDSGAYKLQDNFSEKLLVALRNESVDPEAAKLVTNDLEDMLDKYIKAEVQTMFPKTGVLGNDVDGLITIQRATTDRINYNIKI